MEAFFSFLKVLVLCSFLLGALFLVLLALPHSKLRSVLLELLGWTGGVAATALVVSPVDVIPDVIPVAGQVDDVLYLVLAIGAFWTAWQQRNQRQNSGPDRRDLW
jgi:uncharacterized membrane protein YkvA (DUF1232 family)